MCKKVLLITTLLGLSACCPNATAAEEVSSLSGQVVTECGTIDIDVSYDKNNVPHLKLTKVSENNGESIDQTMLAPNPTEPNPDRLYGRSNMSNFIVSNLLIEPNGATGELMFINGSSNCQKEDGPYHFTLVRQEHTIEPYEDSD